MCRHACAYVMGLALFFWSPVARAIDLGLNGDLLTDTAGFREWLKKSTDAKKYGAERVQDRNRTPFQPDGIRAGSFMILPSFGVAGVYDDNIFTTKDNRQSDYRSELTPTIRVYSDFPRHALRFTLGGKAVNYKKHRDLDYLDGFASFDGALHFDHAHTLSFSASSEFLHDERTDPLSPAGAKNPISHWDNAATVAITRDAGRLYGTFAVTAKSQDYRDATALDGTTIDQDFRDSQTYISLLRMGYRFSPGFELVGKTRVLRELVGDTTGIRRDNTGYEAVAGLSFQTSPLLRFHLLAGYGYRDYDNASLDNVGTALFEGGLQWLPTRLMTISATLRREIGQISSSDRGLRIETRLRGNVQYEIWRNLLLNVDASLEDASSTLDSRHDLTFGGGIGLEYLRTKYWAFNVSYEYLERRSGLDEFGFRQNRVRIGARLRF